MQAQGWAPGSWCASPTSLWGLKPWLQRVSLPATAMPRACCSQQRRSEPATAPPRSSPLLPPFAHDCSVNSHVCCWWSRAISECALPMAKDRLASTAARGSRMRPLLTSLQPGRQMAWSTRAQRLQLAAAGSGPRRNSCPATLRSTQSNNPQDTSRNTAPWAQP